MPEHFGDDMKTRDELAKLAERAHDDWCMENEDRDPWHADAWKHVADAILAADAGWSKRTGATE
jgi:hypothetical protein